MLSEKARELTEKVDKLLEYCVKENFDSRTIENWSEQDLYMMQMFISTTRAMNNLVIAKADVIDKMNCNLERLLKQEESAQK